MAKYTSASGGTVHAWHFDGGQDTALSISRGDYGDGASGNADLAPMYVSKPVGVDGPRIYLVSAGQKLTLEASHWLVRDGATATVVADADFKLVPAA